MAIASTGRSIGSVWSTNIRHGPAPSTRAASNGSTGSDWSAGEQDEEHERRPLPDVEGDEPEEGAASGRPRIWTGLAAELLGDGREHAGIARVDEPEDDADDDRRDDHRHDERRSHEPDPAEFAGAEERERQAEHRLDGDRQRDEA